MILLACILLLFAPLACLGLNRLLPTRTLVLASTLLCGLAALLFVAARLAGASAIMLDLPYAELAASPIRLLLEIAAPEWALLIVVLALASMALFGVGLALPGEVRGFAGVPAAFILLICTVLVGIVNRERLFEPFLLMVAVVLCTITLRASGGIADSDAPLIVLLAGSFAFVLVLASQYLGGGLGSLCCILACLLLIGSAPFGSVAVAISEAPAGLGGTLLGVGLPMLGGQLLIRHMTLNGSEQAGLLLTILGITTLFVCAARGLAETRGRPLIAWQHAAQYGLFFVAVGQGTTLLTTIAPLLLILSACTTIAASFVIAALERRGGTDDLAAPHSAAAVILPGLALLVAGAAAVGVPGTLGMFARVALFNQLAQSGQTWAIGLVLAGSGLLALSYLAPLASLWRGVHSESRLVSGSGNIAQLLPALMVLPVLMLVAYPQIVGGPETALTTRGVLLVAALLLLGVPIWLIRRTAGANGAHADEQAAGAILPVAFAESVAGMAWLAAPAAALNLAWLGLLRISQSFAWLLAWIERRYYLAGLTIALIVIIFIFL